MKNSNLYVLVLSIFLCACEDKIKNKIYIKEEIKGEAFLTDPFYNFPDTVASQAKIYLSENQGTENYLLSTSADSDGKFSFSHRPSHNNFFIIAQCKNTEGILFESIVSFPQFSGNISLLPKYPGEKIWLQVRDHNTHPVFGAEVYLFINEAQANSLLPSASGFIRKGFSNHNGTVFFYNLSPGKYYVNSKYQNLFQITPSEVTLPALGNIPETLSLSPGPELIVSVRDSVNHPFFNAEVHLFSSENQAASINSPTPASFRKGVTDRDGFVKFRELSRGSIYYADVRYGVVVNDSIQIVSKRGGAVLVTFPGQVTLNL